MFEMIESRRKAEKKEERSDLFSSLMDAADEDAMGSVNKITDRELVGNIFIFLYVLYSERLIPVLCTDLGEDWRAMKRRRIHSASASRTSRFTLRSRSAYSHRSRR